MTITVNLPIDRPVAAVKAAQKSITRPVKMVILQTKLRIALDRMDITESIRLSKKIIVL